MRSLPAVAWLLPTMMVGCNAAFGIDDLSPSPPAPGSGASTAAVGGGGSGGSGTGASGGASAGGAGGVGGAGGALPTLVDQGLLVRYFIDEADSGQVPLQLEDAAPQPLPLPISYSAELSYVENAGQRGLQWTGDTTGRAHVDLTGTKVLTRLQGQTAITIEAVVEPGPVSSGSDRMFFVGNTTDDGRLSGKLESAVGTLALNFNQPNINTDTARSIDVLASGGRMVVHLVIDTTEPTDVDRALIYVDGTPAALASGGDVASPALAETLAVQAGELVLGNRVNANRAFIGVIYYFAIYTSAFNANDVARNAMLLSADDDTPAQP